MNYLEWLEKETATSWWHDSAIPAEIDRAIEMGATGVTTNPVLTFKTLQAVPDFWQDQVSKVPEDCSDEERAEALLKIVATYAAKKLERIFEESEGEKGYALGQLNPSICADSDAMLKQALRYQAWAPNISVKLPTTGAAISVVEELAARGIAVCTTLNFSVSQALAAGAAYERGRARAIEKGISPKPCFVVQQGGRLDEYLTDVAVDNQIPVLKEDLLNAGNIVTKRTYALFQERGYHAYIMPAGLRGVHHISGLAGARVVFSLQARVQDLILNADLPKVERYQEPIDEAQVARLKAIPEFVRAYEIDGLKQNEFVQFGVTQKTLSQFLWTGWAPLETYGVSKVSTRWF